jgi:hypothetical protein
VINEDSVVFDDDVVEINTMEDPSIHTNLMTKKKVQKKRRKTSTVWTYFDELPSTDPNDTRIWAKCKFCDHKYIANSSHGTGNLQKHMKVCGGKNDHDIQQMLLSRDQRTLSVSASKFCPKRYKELLVGTIIKHDLPFSYVEYEGVREMHRYLRSDVPLISRNTAKADLIKMHMLEKQKVKALLNVCPGMISLTSNLWTSLTTDGYICLTAHFIDKNWVLSKRVLSFSFIPSPHNGASLAEKIHSLLEEWEIDKKVFSITLDNASANDLCVVNLKAKFNMKKALPLEGELFHMRCCTHTLNLIVQDGLKEITDAIQKIRDSVKYFRGSQMRKQSFLQAASQMSLDSNKGLRQDVPTRWNSTYLMLESAIHYRPAFAYLEMTDENYTFCPNAIEWEKVNDISSFLGCFYRATCTFSGTKYPTANLYFPVVALIYLNLKQELVSEDGYRRLMACQMISKFEKYWSEFSLVLAIAVVLDPRYKLRLVKYFYTKIYGPESQEYENVTKTLTKLFMEYSAPMTSSSTVVQPQEDSDWEKVNNITSFLDC